MKEFFVLHKKITIAIYFVLGILVIFFSRATSVAQNPDLVAAQPAKGFRAMDFTLKSIDGKTYNLHDFWGKVIVVNFWASWCPPCRVEMPIFQKLSHQFQYQDVIILTVNVTSQDSMEKLVQFINDNQLDLPILLDSDGKVSRLYQIQALPTTYIINTQGVIEDILLGGPVPESLLLIRIQQAQRK
ncbi:MAG: TlpA disulfide reductase family protein [Anaerolineales bacterium]